MARRPQQTELSHQERRVVCLSMEELGDKEVATTMGLAVGTVRTYWKRIAQKTRCHTRAEIIAVVSREDRAEEMLELRAEVEALG